MGGKARYRRALGVGETRAVATSRIASPHRGCTFHQDPTRPSTERPTVIQLEGSMRPRTQVSVLIASATLVACASSGNRPPPDDPSHEHIIATDVDGRVYRSTHARSDYEVFVHGAPSVALAVLAQVYGDLGVPVSTLSSSRGQIGNTHFRVANHRLDGKRLSLIVDCGIQLGIGARADVFEVSMSVVSIVTAEGDSSVVVTTTVAGRARSAGVSSDWVECPTTGYLEKVIDSRLRKGLAGS
jgi:hypothetical protein